LIASGRVPKIIKIVCMNKDNASDQGQSYSEKEYDDRLTNAVQISPFRNASWISIVLFGKNFLILFARKSHCSRRSIDHLRYSAICSRLTVYEKPFFSCSIIFPKLPLSVLHLKDPVFCLHEASTL